MLILAYFDIYLDSDILFADTEYRDMAKLFYIN